MSGPVLVLRTIERVQRAWLSVPQAPADARVHLALGESVVCGDQGAIYRARQVTESNCSDCLRAELGGEQ